MAGRLQFGVYEVDLLTRELRRAGVRVAVQPQPLTLLIALASRAGEALTREELRVAVWGSDTHVDFDHGLNFCVAQLRRTLQDSATSPRFIETLPRVGYRFLVPVRRLDGATVTARAQEAPPRAARAAGVPLLPLASLVAAVLLTLGLATTRLRPVAARAPESAPSESYVKGLYHARQGPADLPLALLWLERALAESPSDNAPRIALASTYYRAAETQVRSGWEVFPRALEVAAAAVERDPESAEARLWHGLALAYGRWDWVAGGEELRRATELAPRSVTVLRAWAAYRAALGDDAGALEAIERARRVDPVCLTLTGEQAMYLYRARRFDEAARAWSALLRVRDDAGPHEGLFHLHRAGGRPQAAAAEALRVMALAGVPRATVDALAGRAAPEVVRAFLRGSLAHLRRPGSWTGPERLALMQAALGETDGALDLLDRACREHSPGLPATLRDPAFDSLRGTPRFRAVLDCAGLGGLAPPRARAAGHTLSLAVATLSR